MRGCPTLRGVRRVGRSESHAAKRVRSPAFHSDRREESAFWGVGRTLLSAKEVYVARTCPERESKGPRPRDSFVAERPSRAASHRSIRRTRQACPGRLRVTTRRSRTGGATTTSANRRRMASAMPMTIHLGHSERTSILRSNSSQNGKSLLAPPVFPNSGNTLSRPQNHPFPAISMQPGQIYFSKSCPNTLFNLLY